MYVYVCVCVSVSVYVYVCVQVYHLLFYELSAPMTRHKVEAMPRGCSLLSKGWRKVEPSEGQGPIASPTIAPSHCSDALAGSLVGPHARAHVHHCARPVIIVVVRFFWAKNQFVCMGARLGELYVHACTCMCVYVCMCAYVCMCMCVWCMLERDREQERAHVRQRTREPGGTREEGNRI